MTTIARETAHPIVRREPLGALRRAAPIGVAVAVTVANALRHWFDGIGDGGQIGADYEIEIGRATGARI